MNQKLRHQAIKDSFETLKQQLKQLGYYKAYSIVTLAEACYHQENRVVVLPTIHVKNTWDKTVTSPPATVEIWRSNTKEAQPE